MYIEKKIIKGKPYYYLRQKIYKNRKQTTDTISYLGKNIAVAYIIALLIRLKIVRPKLAP